MGVMMKTVLKHGFRLVLVAVGLYLVLWGSARALRPSLPDSIRPAAAAEQLAAAVARDATLPLEKPLSIYRDVDYSEGASAAWWPKGESPILAGLVSEGKLPPVAERVGPEPLVYEGVDGIGTYGGTWMRVWSADETEFYATYELGCATINRWSPYGDRYVPHLAKQIDVSDDRKVFTIHLRNVRWSDGHPFTADDVMFWWADWANWKDEKTGETLGMVPELVKIRGEYGTIEKVDRHTVRYTFPHPYGTFPEYMATMRAAAWSYMPAHYLRPYHPEYGDKELIKAKMEEYQVKTVKALFDYVRKQNTPGRPTLGPWVVNTYRTSGPFVLVRNPYYYVVDTQGNQLPYIDRILAQVKNPKMVALSVANGDASLQVAGFADYSMLMAQKEAKGYELYHWYDAGRSTFVIQPNLNLLVDPKKPATAKKATLLAEVTFRRALSYALDRQAIIDAVWSGIGEPSQVAPGEESLYYHAGLKNACIEYDPARANKILDGLGLEQRDSDGFRMFPDGSRMVFYVNASQGQNTMGPAQFVVKYWRKVGIRAVLRERAGQLAQTEIHSRTADFYIGEDDATHSAVSSRYIVPQNGWSAWAAGWGTWYYFDGMADHPRSKAGLCVRPPEGHPMLKSFKLLDDAFTELDPRKRAEIFKPAMDIAAENMWVISIATPPPVPVVVAEGLRGVPRNLIYGFLDFGRLNNAYPETWYWESPAYGEGERESIKHEVAVVTPRHSSRAAAVTPAGDSSSGRGLGRLISWCIKIVVLGLLVLLVVKHPFIGRRLALMVPTLLIVSIGVFFIIQISPGNYIDAKIQQLEMEGLQASQSEIKSLKDMFYLEEPVWKQYMRWSGAYWFLPSASDDDSTFISRLGIFQEKNAGLLQGHLGLSMDTQQPVNDMVGDRILLTLVISLGTILFTWIVAVPIGIYSAVKQYSIGDYVLTFLGMVGVCVPQFLLALVLIYVSDAVFGIEVTGLFSPEYAAQSGWTWGKVADLGGHIWLPVVVLGVGGTAGMIRIMRANLLDELRKPYVVTARAKGVRPLRLLLKYPVRMALNPFISGIGGVFPMLISGGAIVAMVLSLPTVGPLLLDAVLMEDTYMAGSMLMVLSLLGIVGVLISDLLLLWVDPRIRMGGR